MAKRISLDQFSAGIVSHYGRNVMTRKEVISYATYAGVGRAGWDDDSPQEISFASVRSLLLRHQESRLILIV